MSRIAPAARSSRGHVLIYFISLGIERRRSQVRRRVSPRNVTVELSHAVANGVVIILGPLYEILVVI